MIQLIGTSTRVRLAGVLWLAGLAAMAAQGQSKIAVAANLGNAPVNGAPVQQQHSFTVNSNTASYRPTVGLQFGKNYSVGPVSCTQTYDSTDYLSDPYVNNCTVIVTFAPLYPGGHRDALYVFDSNGTTILSATFLYGIGQAPQLMIQPGVDTTTTLPGNGNLYGNAVDDKGTFYVSTNGGLYSVAPGVTTQLMSKFPSASNLSVDGAGNVFVSGNGGGIYSGNEYLASSQQATYASLYHYTPCMCQQNPQILAYYAYFDNPTAVSAGNYGTFYEADFGGEYKDATGTTMYPPLFNGVPYTPTFMGSVAGTPGAVYDDNAPLASEVEGGQYSWPGNGLYQPNTMLVDAYENLFFADQSGIREWSGWVQGGALDATAPTNQLVPLLNTAVPVGSMTADAADTLYVSGGSGVQMYPSSNTYASPIATIGISNGVGFSGGASGSVSGPDGTLFVNSGSNLHVIDRSQGLLNFTGSDGSSNGKTATFYNGGNQPLTISSIAINSAGLTSGFTMAGMGGNPCSNGLTIAVGGLCQLQIVSTAPHVGALSGAITVTSNTLNTTGTAQTIALMDNISGIYAVASPNPLNFPPVATGATSTLPVTVVNTSVPSTAQGYPSTIIVNNGSFTSTNPAFMGSPGACNGVSEPSGASYCTINVTYNPALSSSLTGTISWQEAITSACCGAPPTETISLAVTASALLTITANNATRNFLGVTPAYSYTASGFVNGDTQAVLSGSPVYSAPPALNVLAGAYPIAIVSQGTLSAPSYYTLRFLPGTLTVNGNVQQVTTFTLPPSISIAIGKLTLVAHSSSGLPITYTVNGPATLSGYTLTLTGMGTVTVTAMQAGNTTFNPAASVVRTFTVTP